MSINNLRTKGEYAFVSLEIHVNLIDDKCLVCAHFQINVLAAIPSPPNPQIICYV